MFNAAGNFTQTVILRLPLQGLKQHASFQYNYLAETDCFTYTPVMGATTTMYWGAHLSNSMLRIYSWAENSTNYSYYDSSVPAYTYISRNAKCPGQDKKNWCARLATGNNIEWYKN